MKFLSIALLFILSFELHALTATTLNYSLDIAAPTELSVCGTDLFIYSAKDRAIYRNNIFKKDTVQKVMTLKEELQVSSMACKAGQLVMATWNKNDKLAQLMNINKLLYKLPSSTLVRKISCLQDDCLLLQEQLFESKDLNNWVNIFMPSAGEIPPSNEQIERNPFADWQRSLNVFNGRYIDVMLNKNRIWLLDTFLVKVINAKIENQNVSDIKKWGRWGVWDENMLFPKAFAFLNEDVLIVDSGLKALFLFDIDGKNKAVLGLPEKNKRFAYPIDLKVVGEHVWVADYLANKVYSLEIPTIHETKNVGFREHHYRHPDVIKNFSKTRCLNCHDGTETLNLFKMAETKHHHPIQVVMNDNELKRVDCSSCHQNHHSDVKGLFSDKNGKIEEYDKLPFKFRASYLDVCLSCHKDKNDIEQNHFKLNKKKAIHSVVSCNQCHQMHEGEKKLLALPTNNLCLNCHKNHSPQSHFFAKDMSCISCHSMHGSQQKISFARHGKNGVDHTCLNCHKEKIDLIGKNKHMQQLPHHKYGWPSDEQVCLSCHTPHQKQTTAKSKCIACHTERMHHQHQRDISISQTDRTENVVLDVDNKLSCITCHDPHNAGDKNKYLRDRTPILKMCSSCHDRNYESELYDNFHKIFNKKAGTR